MTTFPDWTGPEAVRRLNGFRKSTDSYTYQWPEDEGRSELQALQQLMVDTAMPKPKDDAEELWNQLLAATATDDGAIPVLRAALAKARGDRG